MGCAAPRVYVYDYTSGGGPRIVQMPEKEMQKVCSSGTTISDAGRVITDPTEILACTGGKTIFLSDPRWLTHELCHFYGQSKCDSFDWRDE